MDLVSFAGLVPQALEDLGGEISAAWPIMVLLMLVLPVLWRLVKWGFGEMLTKQLEPILREVKPNGGSSMKDAVDAVRTDVSRVAEGVAHIGRKVENQDARTRALASALLAAYYETDESGEVTYVNDAYCTLTGLTHGEAMRGRLKEVVSSQHDEQLQAEIDAAMKSERMIAYNFDIVHATTGDVVTVTLRAYPIFDENGFAGHAGTIFVI